MKGKELTLRVSGRTKMGFVIGGKLKYLSTYLKQSDSKGTGKIQRRSVGYIGYIFCLRKRILGFLQEDSNRPIQIESLLIHS